MISTGNLHTWGAVATAGRRPTTHGTIALFNLDAQIVSLQQEALGPHGTAESRAALAEWLTLRGLILGSVADYERAKVIIDELVREADSDPDAILARARIGALFHRFAEALEYLDRAEHLGLDDETANGERASIFQALGRYDEALIIRQQAADRRWSFETVGALASLWAEMGRIEAAESLYEESLTLYRGVSPFAPAQLDFQMGLMWMNNDRLLDAQRLFESAVRRVPAYAPAQGHLAEVEADLGQMESAIARLYPLAQSSDDPDYAGQLARLLAAAGLTVEAARWRQRAAARYEQLVAAHPAAYADHAAEFWLACGSDPAKALRLAEMNLAVRQTPRARDLLFRTAAAVRQPVRSAHPSRDVPLGLR